MIDSILLYRTKRGDGLKLQHVIWKDEVREKIAVKHGVTEPEVEEVLFSEPHIRLAEKGRVKGEHLYFAYGQTDSGRYLVILFIWKGQGSALPISARDMTTAERRYYNEQNEAT